MPLRPFSPAARGGFAGTGRGFLGDATCGIGDNR